MEKFSVKFLTLLISICILLSGCAPADNTLGEPTGVTTTLVDITDEVDPYSDINVITEAPDNYIYNNGDVYYCCSSRTTGELFVNHSAEGDRGGHFGHAMVEYEDGKILAFYPNCNDDNKGHTGRGWMEYKRSEDYGETWSEPIKLQYSYDTYMNTKNTKSQRSVMCEKAVLNEDGDIILFCCNCDVGTDPIADQVTTLPEPEALWEPYLPPTYLVSKDGGESWEGPYPVCDYNGRVYDAVVRNGIIMALVDSWDDGKFALHSSNDGGKTFKKKGDIPYPENTIYGNLEFLKNGALIAYTYTQKDEQRLYYSISDNGGITWSAVKTAYFEKMLRNPQIVRFGDSYFAFGRSGHLNDKGPGDEVGNFVMYCSKDGMNWDEGRYLKIQDAGTGAYSNTLVVGTFNDEVPDRLYVQASHAYKEHLTNIFYWWFDAYTLVKD